MSSTTVARLTFRSHQRLTGGRAFERVYKTGRRSGDALFAVVAASNELDYPRLGMAVGVKMAGNAISRNRIRRTIRETFRQLQHQLPAVDIVVNARAGSRTADRSALVYSLETLFAKATRR